MIQVDAPQLIAQTVLVDENIHRYMIRNLIFCPELCLGGIGGIIFSLYQTMSCPVTPEHRRTVSRNRASLAAACIAGTCIQVIQRQLFVVALFDSIAQFILLIQIHLFVGRIGQLQALHQIVSAAAVYRIPVGIIGPNLCNIDPLKLCIGNRGGAQTAQLVVIYHPCTGQFLFLPDQHGAATGRNFQMHGQTICRHLVRFDIIVIRGKYRAILVFDGKATVIFCKPFLTADSIDRYFLRNIHGLPELRLRGIIDSLGTLDVCPLIPQHGAFSRRDRDSFAVSCNGGHGELFLAVGIFIPQSVTIIQVNVLCPGVRNFNKLHVIRVILICVCPFYIVLIDFRQPQVVLLCRWFLCRNRHSHLRCQRGKCERQRRPFSDPLALQSRFLLFFSGIWYRMILSNLYEIDNLTGVNTW